MEFGTWRTEPDRLEHGQQNKIGTWTTEQHWNKDNGTGLKHKNRLLFVTRIPE